jgi:hypothetical protein
MGVILGVLGWLLFVAGGAGLVLLPDVMAMQAGILMVCGAVMLGTCHVAERVDQMAALFSKTTRPGQDG